MKPIYYIRSDSHIVGETRDKEQALRIYEYYKECSEHIELYEDTYRTINTIREEFKK